MLKNGLEVLEREGIDPKTILGFNAVLDNFSDAVILNTIYSLDSSKPFISSMNANNIIVPDENMELGNPIVSLRNLLENENGYRYNYSRYWHGYIIYLKPLLVFFNYSVIRIICTSIILILGIIFIYLLYKKIGKYSAIFAVATLLLISYQITGVSFQYFSVFCIAISSSIYILIKYDDGIDITKVFFIIRNNYIFNRSTHCSSDNFRNTINNIYYFRTI